MDWRRLKGHWAALDSQACGPSSSMSLFSIESFSGEEQGASSAPGAPKAWPATPGLGNRIRTIQESVGKVGAGGARLALGTQNQHLGHLLGSSVSPLCGLGRDRGS